MIKLSFGEHLSSELVVMFFLLPAHLPQQVFFIAVGNAMWFSDDCLCRLNDPLKKSTSLSPLKAEMWEI